MSKLMPRQPVPDLEVQTLDHGAWKLSEQAPEKLTLIAFYRGLHCPICKMYLGDLNRKVQDFKDRGVNVITISSDDEDRARQAKDGWEIGDLPIGYGLGIEAAREWGLYISSSRGKTSLGIEEPPLFNEPGLFLVQPDGVLYWGMAQTMPFARPHFAEILGALDKIFEMNYPARGEA